MNKTLVTHIKNTSLAHKKANFGGAQTDDLTGSPVNAASNKTGDEVKTKKIFTGPSTIRVISGKRGNMMFNKHK